MHSKSLDIIAKFDLDSNLIPILQASVEHLEKHYADLSKKGFFRGLVTYMASGPVCAMVGIPNFLSSICDDPTLGNVMIQL